jgi:uncharacterized protein (TIGR02266 family)
MLEKPPKRRILIADDTVFFQATLRKLFEQAGYDVLTASDGEEALRKAMQSMPALDLALVDLLMPKLTGFEVIESIRQTEHGKLLPVVAMTSLYRKEDYLEMLRRLNASGYLDKSMPPEEILFYITNLLYPRERNARKHPRIVAHFLVSYRAGSSSFQGYVYTVSEGGMFIRTTRPLEMGEALEVAFVLPGSSARILAQGEVIHRQTAEKDFYLYPPGMGIRFTGIAPQDAALVRVFIENEIWNQSAAP